MTEATKKRDRQWRKADGTKLPPAPKPAPSSHEQADLFGNGPNAATFSNSANRMCEFAIFAPGGELENAAPAERAMRFMQGLAIPEGPNAGQPVKLAPFQRRFIEGALASDTANAILSIGRGNGKSAITAGLGLGGLIGIWDRQPRREIIAAARTRDQGRIIWDFVAGFAATLPLEIQRQLIYRRAPRLEIEFTGDGGGHVLRVIAADGKSALGGAPTMAILDERGHWALDRGDELEHALLSGLGKRDGRAFLISTSASDDAHPFSRWIDDPLPGTFVQEHRPAPGLPADDPESLLIANPGAPHGIGGSLDWLEAQAKRAIARGGSSLTSFRLYNRNERVSGESRDLLITLDEWLACETEALPPRQGGVVIGIDLGGSASMTAAAFYWPETGRLECRGTFPSQPSLLDRGQMDGVAGRYVEMQDRGELSVLGDKTVPVAPWLVEVVRHVEGQPISAITMDRYKQAELGEAITRAGIRVPLVWRGQGFRDGGEDCERFRRAAFDGQVRASPSLLLRSAFADAVCLRDPSNNLKLAKARATGRIDAAAASVLAVAQGARIAAQPKSKARMAWF
ncbi:Phage Terminase [Marinovum algicola]|uniref:Phage terminase-like protein, large subunit, contains N-terminal HTH domain n=1 Tax=Marinovum algicola TaxID=42444 RepID=A0A975WC85_9RHOB|nr:terminase TerL endonuclease subunit [Marinovum algicola]SEJ87666.1 Phage terminase-like protein, large subunit, contains N-terminal HTH domain [Marinovum algicola]SLN66795.1 Phage Terminase [Marinovum algicola]